MDACRLGLGYLSGICKPIIIAVYFLLSFSLAHTVFKTIREACKCSAEDNIILSLLLAGRVVLLSSGVGESWDSAAFSVVNALHPEVCMLGFACEIKWGMSESQGF